MKIECLYCHKKIKNPMINQVTCGSSKCQRELKTEYQRQYRNTQLNQIGGYTNGRSGKIENRNRKH